MGLEEGDIAFSESERFSLFNFVELDFLLTEILLTLLIGSLPFGSLEK